MDEATVREAVADDPVYQLLLTKMLTGDWQQQKAEEVAWLQLFVAQQLVTYTHDQGCVRLVIPDSLRQ